MCIRDRSISSLLLYISVIRIILRGSVLTVAALLKNVRFLTLLNSCIFSYKQMCIRDSHRTPLGGLWPSKKEAYAMQRNEPIDAETLLSTPLPLAVADSRPAACRAFLVGRCQQGRQKLAVSVALPAAGPGRRDLGPHHPATDCTVPLFGGHLRPHPGAFVPPDRGFRSQPVVLPDRKLRHWGRTCLLYTSRCV